MWFSIIIVFNGLGNISLAIMRYRIGERSFFGGLLENIKWIPMLAIFLGGLSLHVSQALLSHMFEVQMSWVRQIRPPTSISKLTTLSQGSTSKEAEE